MIWQLAEAKNKFSQVMTLALTDGPQEIRRRDETVIVISESEYERLKGQRKNFIEFLLTGPDLSELDLTRDKSPMREFEW